MATFIIYSEQGVSERLKYVLEWIFAEQLSSTFEITDDVDRFRESDSLKISYGHRVVASEPVHIPATNLLFTANIDRQKLAVHRWKKTTILFYNRPGAAIPFDLFAAIFYLISRYEEYLPCQKDRHNRFPASQSVAAAYRFLKEPVVDQWLLHFRQILSERFARPFPPPTFTVRHTFDIDLAWKYRHKSPFRTWGGYGRDLLTGRWREVINRYLVRSGKRQDPYDNFEQLGTLHREHGTYPLFFMLLGAHSRYDKNADPEAAPMQELLQRLARQYPLGIHPSYSSNNNRQQLQKEITLLAATTGRPVTQSRQHYIRLSFPDTYRALIACGIDEDYTMGYPEQNGFRAGTSRPFFWYDLKADKRTALKIHPFTFMDATSLFYQRQSAADAWQEWIHFYRIIQQTQGQFISIWHNFILENKPSQKGWMAVYQKALSVSSGSSFDIH